MMDYFAMRVSVALRTTRSLLRTAKRDLIKAMRKMESNKQLEITLGEDQQSGDVDTLEKHYDELLDALAEELTEVERTEEKDFMTEVRTEDELQTLEHWFRDVKKKLEVEIAYAQNNNDAALGTFQKLHEEFTKLESHIKEIEQQSYDELTKQFRVVEREASGDTRAWQMATWNIAPVMESMRQLWKLRGEFRREQKDEGELEDKSKKIIQHLDNYLKSKDKESLRFLTDEVKHHEIKKTFEDFKVLLEKMQQAFTLIMKTCVQIYFRVQQDEGWKKNFLEDLKQSGFPTGDWEKLHEAMTSEEHTVQERLHHLINAMTRGRRELQT